MKLKPFQIEHYYLKHEFTAPYQMSASDSEPYTMSELLALASDERRKQFENLWLGYTEPKGNPELLKLIANLYQDIEAEHVLEIVPEEGIFIAMNTLLDAGDHVVAIFPSYQSLYEVGRAVGCELTFWQPEQTDTGWSFDIDKLENMIQPNTKMLVVNFPHNPTGYLPTQEEYNRIVEIARQHDLILFSDEIYRFSEHDPKLRLTSGCEIYDKAVVLGGLSKSFGLAGLRVGWLGTQNASFMKKFLDFKFYTTICSSAPSEILAIIALENHQTLASRNIEIVKHNIAVAKAFFERYQDWFWVSYPNAGTITLAELKANMNVHDFAESIVKEAGVMVLPANIMNFEGNYFRLGFGRRDLPQVFEHFEDYITEQFTDPNITI